MTPYAAAPAPITGDALDDLLFALRHDRDVPPWHRNEMANALEAASRDLDTAKGYEDEIARLERDLDDVRDDLKREETAREEERQTSTDNYADLQAAYDAMLARAEAAERMLAAQTIHTGDRVLSLPEAAETIREQAALIRELTNRAAHAERQADTTLAKMAELRDELRAYQAIRL